MDSNELLSGFKNQEFKIDLTHLAVIILGKSIRCEVYLREVLTSQIEIKELIQGKTPSEIDEYLQEKLDALENDLEDIVEKDYLETILQVIRS
ncbi:MAG: hypothetical protein WC150_05095 [Bacteroidia bacterium]